jgi:hypothetical protein
MTAAGLLPRSRISIALGCLALVLTIALAEPTVAAGQEHEQGRVPSTLWETYPFAPGERTGSIRIEPGADGWKTITPSVATTTPVETDAEEPEGQTSSRGEPSRTFSVALLALALLALLVIVAVSATPAGERARLLPRIDILSSQAVFRWPSRRTSAQAPFMPTKKGPSMPKPRRRPRKRGLEPTSSSGHLRDEGGNESLTSTDAPGSPGKENDPKPSEIRSGARVDIGDGEDAIRGEVAETDELQAVAVELQAVLASAKEAAVNIRRRAEEDAERLRLESASTAEAELAEARRIANSERAEAERSRAEAATFAADTRAAAEREAARIAEEAQRRLDEADTEVAERFRQAESEAAERVETLHAEIRGHEQRLESILVMLGAMTSQLEDLLGQAAARDQGAEPPAESLDDVLRPDRSTQQG